MTNKTLLRASSSVYGKGAPMRNYVELFTVMTSSPSKRCFMGRTMDEAMNVYLIWQAANGGTFDYAGRLYILLDKQLVFFLTGLSTYTNSAIGLANLWYYGSWTAWNAGNPPNVNAGLTLSASEVIATESPRPTWSHNE